jgi:hypothetical protein
MSQARGEDLDEPDKSKVNRCHHLEYRRLSTTLTGPSP